MIRSRKAFQTGVLHSRSGATAVIFVISLAGSWRSSFPVCRSTMPAGVFSSHGSASHTSLLAANRRSALASFSIAEIVLAVVIPAGGFPLPYSLAADRQHSRARLNASSVFSGFQRAPSHLYHVDWVAT